MEDCVHGLSNFTLKLTTQIISKIIFNVSIKDKNKIVN